MSTPVWGSSDGGIEICPKCGAKYRVTLTRLPCRDKDSFHCNNCGELISEWNDTEFPSYSPIEEDSK